MVGLDRTIGNEYRQRVLHRLARVMPNRFIRIALTSTLALLADCTFLT